MEELFGLVPSDMIKSQLMQELRKSNSVAAPYGLALTEAEIVSIANRRMEALEAVGRVEFGSGVAGLLVREFCDSPYLTRENFEETILELMDAFYYFKNESKDLIRDDELIAMMKRFFDTTCQGSVEYLTGTTLEEICRSARAGDGWDDEVIYDQILKDEDIGPFASF
jgi:hypothetical protein